jgi:hypothetical protein
MFRTMAATVTLLAAVAWGGTTAAQAQQPAGGPKVTLKYENANVAVVLKDLFTQAKAKYKLSLASPARVTLSLSNVSFKLALESILQASSLNPRTTYRVEKGVYIVEQRKSKPSKRHSM